MFEPLSDEEVTEALAAQRSKGEYKAILVSFMEAKVRAARIPTDRGKFEGRKASTVKTGFENARKADDDAVTRFKSIKVSSKGGNVYLINESIAAPPKPKADAEDKKAA